MKVSDFMTRKVVSATPTMPIAAMASLMVEQRLSALPVIDGAGRLVGIVSESDLMRRPETATERQSSWWLRLFAAPETLAERYVKSHGLTAKEIMTAKVVSIEPNASLAAAAELMDKHRVKRLPVTHDGILVGIIARADLVRALTAAPPALAGAHDDTAIRERLEEALRTEHRMIAGDVSVTVLEHTAHLWGSIESAKQSEAVALLAQRVPGVRSVRNHLVIRPSPINPPLLIP